MALILDAGAFIAVERRDRSVGRMLVAARAMGLPRRTNGAVLAQVWRGGTGRQAPVAQLLKSVTVVPVDSEVGRAAGDLLAMAARTDAVDASLVTIARDGDRILTGDRSDIGALADAAGLRITVVGC